MRAALGALTTRGRAFLSSGLTALAASVALGLDDLARIGALVVALPLVAAAVLSRTRHRLGLVRTVTPTRLAAGQSASVELVLTNEGRAATGLLLLEEQVPYALGSRPRFVLDRVGPRWRRVVGYTVRSDLRGRFQLGPMSVRVLDPFGMVELDRAFRSTATLVVTPPVVALPPISLTGDWTGSGDNRPRDFTGGSAEDVTVREYRHGDDLRRVHWRATAHAGELMVRREEQPWQSRATVFLDNRAAAHRGAGPASSFEHAVAIAASVVTHLVQRGFTVRMVTADDAPAPRDRDRAGAEWRGHTWHDHGASTTESATLLESLAVLTTTSRTSIDAEWLAEAPQSGVLVAVLGDSGPRDSAVWSRLRHASSQALAVVVDVAQWSTGPGGEPGAVGLLSARGWRAVAAGRDEPLTAVWQRLGLMGRGTTRHVEEVGA